MEKQKKKFSPHIYADWEFIFKDLPSDQLAEILKGITGYPKYEVKDVPIWNFIKSQIDNEYNGFVERCERSKFAANKRWNYNANAYNKMQPNANVCERMPITVTETGTVTKTVTETGTGTETETGIETETKNDINNFIINKCNLLKREIREKRKLGCRFENSDFYAEDIPDAFFNVFDSVLKSDPEVASKGLDANRTYQSFRDYWISKSGKDATKVDWIATWRNWIRIAKPSQKQNTLLSKNERDRQYFEHLKELSSDDSWG